jgi:2,4-dienoyl-CoA reductase-like NADH-dependent reductase (Old Yellow Enzyme family)
MRLKNRLVMAPMETLQAESGLMSSKQMKYYLERARGGVGLVIVEAAGVSSNITMFEGAGLRLCDDSYIPALQRFTKQFHSEGDESKLAIQLAHVLLEPGFDMFAVNTRQGKRPCDLSLEEINHIIDDFANATIRARQAGFDAVEYHMAHYNTVADFLSKGFNTREDEYGQVTEGRARLACEIVKRAREKIGHNFPLICRISGDEYTVKGNTLRQTRIIAQMLEGAGSDAIHVSGGGRLEDGGVRSYSFFRQVPTYDFPDGLNMHLAEGIKKVVSIPVIAVGKIGDPATAEEVLVQGKADLVALGRALLADAAFARKAAEGRSKEIQRCMWCNDCVRLLARKQPVVCTRGALSIFAKKGKKSVRKRIPSQNS